MSARRRGAWCEGISWLLCSTLLAPSAHAAGLKVSLTERAHWPWPLTSPQAFDVASRAEIAVFAEAMADSDARGAAPGMAASVAKWKEGMRKVLVENFAKAREAGWTAARSRKYRLRK